MQEWLHYYKIDFGAKKTATDKEGHNIIVKWQVYREDKGILSVSTANNRAVEYRKQKVIEVKGE